jgi:dUTP pyrophosphatase
MITDIVMNFTYTGKKEARCPVYQHETDAGADLYAAEEAIIMPGQTKIISTGIIFETPKGYEVQIRSRSGLAAKNSIFVLNSPGTIDPDFRGEIKVILHNAGDEKFIVNIGDRIAQAICAPIVKMHFNYIPNVSYTDRGAGGLGSTGI